MLNTRSGPNHTVKKEPKTMLLGHFQLMADDVRYALSEYGIAMAKVSPLGDMLPDLTGKVTFPEAARLKLGLATSLRGFDGMFGRFVASLNSKELGSARKLEFLLVEIFKNQAKIDALYDAHMARLAWLRDPKGGRNPPVVDLDLLPINDAVVMAESVLLFSIALSKLFARSYARFGDAAPKNPGKPKPFVAASVRRVAKRKIKRLEGLGVEVDTPLKEALRFLHGL